MLQLLKKLKLYTKLVQNQYISIQIKIFFVIVYRLLVPTEVFLQVEHHIELLLHL